MLGGGEGGGGDERMDEKAGRESMRCTVACLGAKQRARPRQLQRCGDSPCNDVKPGCTCALGNAGSVGDVAEGECRDV